MIKRFLVTITFFSAMVLSNSPIAIAGGKIEWTPQKIEVKLSEPAMDNQVLANFTSDISLNQITLEVVPELNPFVTVEPAVIQNVQAGVPQIVTLHFSLPPGTEPGEFDGVVHVRSGKRTLPQTLKIAVTVELGSKFLLGTDLPDINGELAVIFVQTIVQGFSLTSPISVSTIKLQMSGFGTDQFTVWVTNSIGPGTTQANVLLQTNATFPNTGGGITGSTVSIPVNLNLPPGDYFIVLSSTQPDVAQGWLLATTTLPSTVGSVGDLKFSLPSNALFPPASIFTAAAFSPAAFQIIGTD